MDIDKANKCARYVVDEIVKDGQTMLEFHSTNKNIVKRVGINQDNNRVAVVASISGGHAHAFVGYVGEGMLTATVVANVLESPSTADIVQAAREVTGSMGVLLIARSYGNDRVNFEKAEVDLQKLNLKVKLLCITDDCSVKARIEKRGLAGTILVIKVAGACAEAGLQLENVYDVSYKASLLLGTIGVSVPFNEQSLKIRYGIGLDEELGALHDKIPLMTMVGQMIDQILSTFPKPKGSKTVPKRNFAVLINLMGPCMSTVDCTISHMAKAHLSKIDLQEVVMFVGPFLPSLSMSGFSISIMEDVSGWMSYLKRPTHAPFWEINENQFSKAFRVLFDVPVQITSPNSETEGMDHDMTLRSVVGGARGKISCWIEARNSYIASDYLQMIIKGLLKLILKCEREQKYIEGAFSLDNIGYRTPNFCEPYFIYSVGPKAASSKVYYEDLCLILLSIRKSHGIEHSVELDNFCSLLQSTNAAGNKARIRNNIFLYNGIQRVEFAEGAFKKLGHTYLSKAAINAIDFDSNERFMQKIRSLPMTSRLYICFHYKPFVNPGCNSTYRNDYWRTIIKFLRDFYGRYTKSMQGQHDMSIIDLQHEFHCLFPEALGKLFHILIFHDKVELHLSTLES